MKYSRLHSKTFTSQTNALLGFTNPRFRFYHPINLKCRAVSRKVPYRLCLCVVLGLAWVASARSDALISFI